MVQTKDSPPTSPVAQRIPIDKIRPSHDAHRKYFNQLKVTPMAEYMRQFGLLNPIQVKPSQGDYEIVDGERRWRAARLLGWRSIDATVVVEG